MRNEINSREKKFGISLFVIPLLSVYKVRNHDFLYVFFLGIPLLRLNFTKRKTEISILFVVLICKFIVYMVSGWKIEIREDRKGLYHYGCLVVGEEYIKPFDFPSVQFKK